jgi:hypothetical protein
MAKTGHFYFALTSHFPALSLEEENVGFPGDRRPKGSGLAWERGIGNG